MEIIKKTITGTPYFSFDVSSLSKGCTSFSSSPFFDSLCNERKVGVAVGVVTEALPNTSYVTLAVVWCDKEKLASVEERKGEP